MCDIFGIKTRIEKAVSDANEWVIKLALPSDKQLELIETLDRTYDSITARGFVFPDHLKRRDPREPHRTLKEAFEDKIEKLIKRLFGKQEKMVLSYFEYNVPRWNQMQEPPDIPEDNYKDDDIEKGLFFIFLAMALDANNIMEKEIGIPLEAASNEALMAARVAVGDLIRNINDTTKEQVQNAIAMFVDTPGMTLNELSRLLPFPEHRARLIAVTEVSNIYGEMVMRETELLMKAFPGALVVRIWFTNNDPNVCPICKGLDGKEAIGLAPFISDFDGGEYYTPGSGVHPGCRCWTSVTIRSKED